MKAVRWLGAGLLAASASLGTGEARAFCRTRTCDASDAAQECDLDANECVTTGRELYWSSSCVTFAVQRDGSPAQGIDADTVASVAEKAFSRWLDGTCNAGHPSIQIGNVGAVDCAVSQYNERGRNANVIIFRDEAWPYAGALDTYGFTRVRFDKNTGEIFDADIEINSFDFDLSLDGEDGADLESILTHEIGHFLGLSHAAPDLGSATMRAGWDGDGTELRTLSADDNDGICAIYPPERQPATTSCEPRHGFARECNVALPEGEGGCNLSRKPANAWHALLVAGLLASWLRRRTLTRSPCS
jgi:hypothetical protein